MGDYGILGLVAMILLGGFAGWLASRFMKSNNGIVMDVVLGVVGASIASILLGFFDVAFSGLLGYLFAGFIGACLLIWVARAVRGSP